MTTKQELSLKALSDFNHFDKYAKFIPEYNRREGYYETVTRNKEMHLRKFPELEEEILKAYKFVYAKKVLPSMRSMQFGGRAIELNNARMFNCCYLPMDDRRAFREVLFLLLGGSGVGYSVRKHHIQNMPSRKEITSEYRYLISDDIIGWSNAVDALAKGYLETGRRPIFDYLDIRKKGSLLKTSGGRAPGHEKLKECLGLIEKIFSSLEVGEQLSSLQTHDINCHLADAVLAGGIRRAAMISLFDMNDQEMRKCKFSKALEENPQRGRANNSAVGYRGEITKGQFMSLWDDIENSYTGDPGIILSAGKDWGINPCGEASLRPYQVCNLTEINFSTVEDQEDFNERCWAASFIGTLQASYTDFHYLRPVWRETTERDALLGVGMTGLATNKLYEIDLQQGAQVVLDTNEEFAAKIGINKAARTTLVKPSGTSSCILGTSSGIHAWHDEYYIRNCRMNKDSAIYKYLLENHPAMVEDDAWDDSKAVIGFPVKAPEGSVLRTEEDALDLLERIKHVYLNWCLPGHRDGVNPHNVSATVYIKEDQWETVGEWVWENRDHYSGLAFFPFYGGTHKQTPFESCTKERYEELIENLERMDLTMVVEEEDDTSLQGALACAGGACEI